MDRNPAKDKKVSEWELLKLEGSGHYKTGSVEPIDLYRSLGLLQDFCLASIIKYASRQKAKGVNSSDLEKIIHYARLLNADRLSRNDGK